MRGSICKIGATELCQAQGHDGGDQRSWPPST